MIDQKINQNIIWENNVMWENKISQATTIEQCKEIAREHLNCSKYLLSDHQPLLLIAINSSNPILDLVKSILFKAINENPLDSHTSEEQFDSETSKKKSKVNARPWNEIMDKASDSLIDITYGGGLHFLHKFIDGRHSGYAHEAGGKGMFVTVHPDNSKAKSIQRDRDLNYALRMAPKFYDEPATMTAKIEAQYLTVVNHNASYEAVILPENVRYVQEVNIKDWSPYFIDFNSRKEAFGQIIPATGTYYNLKKKGYTAMESKQLKDSWKEFTDVDLSQFGI